MARRTRKTSSKRRTSARKTKARKVTRRVTKRTRRPKRPRVKKIIKLGRKKGAIKIRRPGAFRAKAKRAGMGTLAFARKVMRAPKGQFTALTRKQASLAITLITKFKKRGRKK